MLKDPTAIREVHHHNHIVAYQILPAISTLTYQIQEAFALIGAERKVR